MSYKVLGLTCLASLTAANLAALETDLAIGPTEYRAAYELVNQHWSNGVALHTDAMGHATVDFRLWDIGLHLDHWMVLDGEYGDREDPSVVKDFETTEVTLRVDYLFEVVNYVQVLPFFEMTSYTNLTSRSPFNWLGLEVWWLTPAEGIEVGSSIRYNVSDNTEFPAEHEHHFVGDLGARFFYQQAPLDMLVWSTFGLASRSFHELTTGADTQGLTTFNLGAKVTMPLPWEELWLYGSAEQHWYLDGDDRIALGKAGRDRAELVLAVGVEWRGIP